MSNWPIFKVKAKHWIHLWWNTTAKDTFAPLVDTNARLQLFALAALLYFILPAQGYLPWSTQIMSVWDSIRALAFAVPVSFFLNGFFAIFKTIKEENELGTWVGIRFIYHTPRHLATIVVTDADNGKLMPFKINGLSDGAGIEVRIERDLHDIPTLNVQFARPDMPIHWDEYFRPTMHSWVPRNKTLYITALKPTPSNASTIKVYLLAWSCDLMPPNKYF